MEVVLVVLMSVSLVFVAALIFFGAVFAATSIALDIFDGCDDGD